MLTWSTTNATSCSASGAWSGSKSTSGSETTAALSASATYMLNCTGTGGSASGGTTVSVTGSITGLDFPGSAATTGTIRFEFTNPLQRYPATYIWRVNPRQQAGYYTTFFWGNNGSFYWDRGSPNSYYGAHPYPSSPPGGSTHQWEIATGGGDYLSTGSVVYDQWYTQALRVWSDAAGKHHEFYWNLPDTTKVIRATESASWGESNPPSPALVWGDAPWNPSNEIMNGVLRGIQIYSTLLSIADIIAETSSPLGTAAGNANIWYLNLNPTPIDIADQSGKGNHPNWVGNERPAPWSGQQQ